MTQPLPPAKILLVDDKPLNLDVLEAMIRTEDHPIEVIKTTDPVQALMLTLTHDFFLILLDVQMPVMDGYELSELLRGQKKTASVPIILVSAVYDREVHIFKGYEAGAVDYIVKPINGALLHNKIRTFEDLYQQQQALMISSETAKKLENEAMVARQAADEANRAKSIFLATMSHEIRTPLNAIVGFSDILMTHTDSLNAQSKQQFQQAIHDSSCQLLSLINNVLDFSKIESGHEDLSASTFGLPEHIQSITETFELQAKSKNISVKLNLADNLPHLIDCDHLKLTQIINNLMSNALIFTPGGGAIELDLIRVEQTLVLKVSDNGIGISAKQQPVIFEPFEQGSVDSCNDEKGTGLGLAISRKLAKVLGGSLTLSSTQGQGSCFTLQIPYKDAKMVLTETLNLPATFASDSRVLVVDDIEANLNLASAFLKTYGVTASCVKSGQQAIDITTQWCEEDRPPELILMDIRMPQMDGLEATAAILAKPTLAKIPIVGLSADVLSEHMNKAKVFGFCDYLTKPIVRVELHKVLARYLRLDK
ncbi:MAG: response regulator [Algicola sp.]|nr:response regulator [Algicola sp.]